MKFTTFLFSILLISSTTLSLATRPGFDGFYGPPRDGFDWRNVVGGYGHGHGDASGGPYSGNGIIKPSVVCREKGSRCYKKKLTCPAKCFVSYSSSGKGYGGGGGGGGCTFDCKTCSAYC